MNSMNQDNRDNVSSSIFWDKCYTENTTGWDLGQVTPVFKDWCDKLVKKSKIFGKRY